MKCSETLLPKPSHWSRRDRARYGRMTWGSICSAPPAGKNGEIPEHADIQHPRENRRVFSLQDVIAETG